MQFTVKQLADILNVSKGTVTNYSNQLKLDLKKNSHGVIILSLDQCISIAEAINENRTELNKVNVDRLYKIKEDSHNKMTDELKEKFNSDTDKVKVTKEATTNQSELIELLKEQINDLKIDKGELTYLLKQQQTLLSQQQSLQLQSNEKIKALEVELREVKEDTKQGPTDISENVPNPAKADTTNQNVKNFYTDLKDYRNNKSFISRLFKRL